jgi:predicted nucleic acid-binding protein
MARKELIMDTQEERLLTLEREVALLLTERVMLDQRITTLQQQIAEQREQIVDQQRATNTSQNVMLAALHESESRQELHFSRLEALILTTARTQEAAMVAMESRMQAAAVERSEQMLAAFRQLLEIVNSRLPGNPT